MVDKCLYVAIGGVFAFDDLDLYLATICEVSNEFALCVKGVPNRSDEVRFICDVWVYVVGDGRSRV